MKPQQSTSSSLSVQRGVAQVIVKLLIVTSFLDHYHYNISILMLVWLHDYGQNDTRDYFEITVIH